MGRAARWVLVLLSVGCADSDGGEPAAQQTDAKVQPDAGLTSDAETPPPDAAAGCTVEWVEFADFAIFAYEASRADATFEARGTATEICSQAGVLPWTDLTLPEAREACSAAGFRLCSDAEWAAACQGDRAWGFPYGDAHRPGVCNDHVSGTGALQPTGSMAECRTPEGVFDLSGNVWEFTDDGGRRGASHRVNAAMFRADAARCDQRYVAFDDFSADDIGFRCCR